MHSGQDQQEIELSEQSSESDRRDGSSPSNWKSATRTGKLFFYLITIGILIFSFISTLGWVPTFDTLFGVLTLGIGIIAYLKTMVLIMEMVSKLGTDIY